MNESMDSRVVQKVHWHPMWRLLSSFIFRFVESCTAHSTAAGPIEGRCQNVVMDSVAFISFRFKGYVPDDYLR